VQLPPTPLTSEVRHNLFLAFKESLHNAVKHAAATEVRIQLAPEPGGFTLLVEDNGKGFIPPIEFRVSSSGFRGPGPTTTPRTATHKPKLETGNSELRISTGHGLTNMRRRLEEISGRCELESRPGTGTRVKFTVAVKPIRPG